jgi:hypothetical protein
MEDVVDIGRDISFVLARWLAGLLARWTSGNTAATSRQVAGQSLHRYRPVSIASAELGCSIRSKLPSNLIKMAYHREQTNPHYTSDIGSR